MMKAPSDLRARTRMYAMCILDLYELMPTTVIFQVVGKQVIRSGTSVGAQYREACRAKSDADMISKFEGMLQELDETEYWLDILRERSKSHKELITQLVTEANELTAIFTTAVLTLKKRRNK